MDWIGRAEALLPLCENKDLMLFVYQNIAICYDEYEQPIKARQFIVQILQDASSGDRSVLTGWSLGLLGRLYEGQGEFDLSAKCFVAARSVFRRHSSKYLFRANERLTQFLERHPELESQVMVLDEQPWQTLVQEILATES